MSIVHKFTNINGFFSWDAVPGEPLNEQGLMNITKHVLIGERESAPHFYMRYFQISPNGHSRLERHPQEHEVIILQGKGQVRIADEIIDVSPFDVVFIDGDELHQFLNPGEQPFGFICVIPKNI